MDYIEFYYGLDYKYMVLTTILNNYYLSNYSKNKFNSKILVLGKNDNSLMSEYDRFFKIIDSLNVNDIKTLIKFQKRNSSKISKLYKRLKDNNLNDEKIIKDLKNNYTRDKSQYYTEYAYNVNNTSDDKNIIFISLDDIESLYDSYMVRDIFVSDYFTEMDIRLGKNNYLLGRIEYLTEKLTKTKDIVKRLTNIDLTENNDFKLNIHIKGDFNSVCALEENLKIENN